MIEGRDTLDLNYEYINTYSLEAWVNLTSIGLLVFKGGVVYGVVTVSKLLRQENKYEPLLRGIP